MEGYGNENPGAFQSTRPRKGRDAGKKCEGVSDKNFNPRAPCGARLERYLIAMFRCYFNPRAPCGARHRLAGHLILAQIFQPTRPLRGATLREVEDAKGAKTFQPTRPLRGATL